MLSSGAQICECWPCVEVNKLNNTVDAESTDQSLYVYNFFPVHDTANSDELD